MGKQLDQESGKSAHSESSTGTDWKLGRKLAIKSPKLSWTRNRRNMPRGSSEGPRSLVRTELEKILARLGIYSSSFGRDSEAKNRESWCASLLKFDTMRIEKAFSMWTRFDGCPIFFYLMDMSFNRF